MTLAPDAPAPAGMTRSAGAGETVTIDDPVTPKSLKSVRVPANVGDVHVVVLRVPREALGITKAVGVDLAERGRQILRVVERIAAADRAQTTRPAAPKSGHGKSASPTYGGVAWKRPVYAALPMTWPSIAFSRSSRVAIAGSSSFVSSA